MRTFVAAEVGFLHSLYFEFFYIEVNVVTDRHRLFEALKFIDFIGGLSLPSLVFSLLFWRNEIYMRNCLTKYRMSK